MAAARQAGRSGIATPRVVELGEGLAAAYCGWLLAESGADVARIVLPRRHTAAGGDPVFAHLDAGKRILAPDPQAVAETLAAAAVEADILLLDLPQRRRNALGLNLEALAASRPDLILATTTVFGEDGPCAGLPAEALDAQAMSGVAWAIGEAGRPPLSLPPDVVECQAGASLAGAIWLACLHRADTGQGQRVDVALADVLAYYAGGNCRSYIHHGLKWHRAGRRAFGFGGAYPYVILPCQDGEVGLICRSRDEWERLIEAMGRPAWSEDPRYQDLRAMGRDYPEEVDALLRPWLAARTRQDLERISVERGIPMAPLRMLSEVLETPQLDHRAFFRTVSAGGRELRAPGLPYRRIRPEGAVPAPMPEPAATWEPGDLPLRGLRVLDLGWVWSAPLVGAILAEFGAEVIKVEHGKRLDNIRLRGRPRRDGETVPGPAIELSPMIHQINHGKKGITLNLKEPAAVDLLERLLERSDVLIENMSPGAMSRVGLGYERAQQINPGLVMLSMSAAGQNGPGAAMRAYAPVMSAFAGLESLIGYPGEAPIGALNFGLGDPNAAMHAAMAVLAALYARRYSESGCHIDLSQIECLLTVMPRQLIEASRTGAQPTPAGNRHPFLAPQGIFPTRGADSWIAISVSDDAAWKALAALANGCSWASDPALGTLDGRRRAAGPLDEALGAWTAGWEREGLVAALRGVGVPASPVLTIEEQMAHPQFAARRLQRDVADPDYGLERLYVTPWRFGRFEPRIERSSPRLGEHNREVFRDLLGLSDGDIDALIRDGTVS